MSGRMILHVEPLTHAQLRALYPDFRPPPALTHEEREARARAWPRGQALDRARELVELQHGQQIERAYDVLRQREDEDEAAAHREYLERVQTDGTEADEDFKVKWRYRRRRDAVERINAFFQEQDAQRQEQARAAREAEAEREARAAVEAEMERRARVAAAEKTARAALRTGAEEPPPADPMFWRQLRAALRP